MSFLKLDSFVRPIPARLHFSLDFTHWQRDEPSHWASHGIDDRTKPYSAVANKR